ncbi:MAG: exodeoxyribonuclease VII small subunit [Pseudomonadota bacterium]
MTKEQKKSTFEEELKSLEEVVRKLEAGDLTLDDSLKAYETGIKLVRSCEAKLNEAKGKIEKLTNTLDEKPATTSMEG